MGQKVGKGRKYPIEIAALQDHTVLQLASPLKHGIMSSQWEFRGPAKTYLKDWRAGSQPTRTPYSPRLPCPPP